MRPIRLHKFRSSLYAGRVAQSETFLATDASLTAGPVVTSLILARPYTFMEIDQEIISTVHLFPFAESFKKGCLTVSLLLSHCYPGSGVVLDCNVS